MPNPYDDELRRQQIGQLRDPVSTTMPVGGAARIAPIAGRAPEGWDQVNWDDPNMHSVKYDAGRLLYGKTRPSEVGATVRSQAFQDRFPGATFNGKDWIDFAGAMSDGDKGEPVYGIDFLKAANADTDTSEGAWWGAPDTSAAPQRQAPSAGGLNPAADNSTLARIMAELQAAGDGTQSPAEREAVLRELQGL